MNYRLISFYSEPENGNYYTKSAESLKLRCKKLGIDCYIEHRPTAGSWVKNTRQKSAFVRECLERFDEPLLWVDVDSLVHSKPDLSGYQDVDFAGGPIVGFQSEHLPHLLIMGICLFFNNTKGALWLARNWEEVCNRQPNENFGDHRLISNILDQSLKTRLPFTWRYLPETYARSNTSKIKTPPVISLGLALTVVSRRTAMTNLRKGVVSSKVDGKVW